MESPWGFERWGDGEMEEGARRSEQNTMHVCKISDVRDKRAKKSSGQG